MSVSGPFLVKNFETINDEQELDIFLVMELCSSNVKEYVEKLNGAKIAEINLMKIIIQSLLGLHELHHQKKFHGNIKLENVFIDHNFNVKIGDYGMWEFLEERLKSITIRPLDDICHVAPEVLEDEAYMLSFFIFLFCLDMVIRLMCGHLELFSIISALLNFPSMRMF